MIKLVDDIKLQQKINWFPHQKQIEIIEAFKRNRDLVICAGRQSGKSMLCAYLIFRTLLADNQHVVICSPSYDLTDRIFYYLKVFMSAYFQKPPVFINKPFPKIVMPWGSFVLGKSADAPAGILGQAFDLIVVDEAPLIQRSIYEQYLYPTTTTRQGKSVFIGTPRGKNWFYEKFLEVKVQGGAFHFTSKDSPYFKESEWERAKTIMPQAVFSQEFEAIFTEGTANVFRNVRDCIDNKPFDISRHQNHRIFFGLDLAKVNDFSVLVGIDSETSEVVYFDRFQKIPYTLQMQRIISAVRKFKNYRIICDTGNIGGSIVDELRSQLGIMKVEGFNLVGTISKDVLKKGSKERLIERLAMFIENKQIRIPNNQILIDELESFGLEISPSGNIVYGAPQGLHDDAVIAMALACWPLKTEEKKVRNLLEEWRDEREAEERKIKNKNKPFQYR